MGLVLSLIRGITNTLHNLLRRNRKGYIFHFTPTSKLPSYNVFWDSCFPGVPIFDQELEGSCVLHALNVAYVCSRRRARERPETVGVKDNASSSFNELMYLHDFKDPERGVSFEAALRHANLEHHRLGLNEENIKNCLANGHVVLLGFQMDSAMHDWQWDNQKLEQTQYVMPDYSVFRKIMGTHAVAVVGWEGDYLVVQNSWGSDWGKDGYFYMPLANINNGCVQDAFFLVT